jgi:SagB-type dehydrogenase family enzyme
MADETPTRLIHRLTSYVDNDWTAAQPDERLVHDFEPNDRTHRPQFYKRYAAQLPRVALPRDLRPAPASALEVLAGTADVAPSPLDLSALGRVLFLASGVTRTSEYRGNRMIFRAAGSAGARFPLELYVAVPGVPCGRDAGDEDALPPGVHWYDPADHALVTIGQPPTGETPVVVVTGVPWRTGWRYRERGFRHIYWDAGTMLSQLLAVADSAALDARLHLGFPDVAVADLVGADGVEEFPVALVALGRGTPALTPAGPVDPGRHDSDGRVFPLVTVAQHAGDRDELGPETARGAPVRLESVARDVAPQSVDDVVLGRGSIRRLDPTRSITRAALLDTMAVAMRGVDVPHWVAVTAVDDVAPGLYRWPDLEHPVRSLDEATLRQQLYVAALEQGLAKDAAYVAISAVDLTTVDDRAYREVQLASGLVEGRLHLAAGALGAAATGMTFIDVLVPALLGEAAPPGLGDDLGTLLWTCVGMGEYRSGRAGTPGAPTEVRIVEPR